MVVVSFEPKTNFLILCFCFPVAVFFRKCVRIGGVRTNWRVYPTCRIKSRIKLRRDGDPVWLT